MSLLPPSPLLPETLNAGDSGHIGHHEQIHHILNELDASDIDIIDSGGYYNGTTVETALQEAGERLNRPRPFVYVDPTYGDDTNDGKSWGTAFATWDAAVAAIDSGTLIQGEIQAYGNFGITAPVVVGDGTKYVDVIITGMAGGYYGSSSAIAACRVTQATNNTDVFQFEAPLSKSHTLIVRGIEAVGPANTSSGIGFNFAPADATSAQWIGATIENCNTRIIGIGYRIGGSIDFLGRGISAISCNKGIQIYATTENANHCMLDRFTVQSCVAAGIEIANAMFRPYFRGVIQSNTGPGILISAGGTRNGYFDLWFEFPGADMIRIDGVSGGIGPLDYATFENCNFDGSSQNRNAIHDTRAAGVGGAITGAEFRGGIYQNRGTGKFIKIDAGTPSTSSGPGVQHLMVFGLNGLTTGDIEGAFNVANNPRSVIWLIGNDYAAGVGIVANSGACVVAMAATGMLVHQQMGLVVGASTTSRAGVRIPHGSAPSAPVDGDIWTTSAGMFVRINGVTKTVTLT